MGSAMRVARWLLVLPSGVAGWYLGLLIGLLIYEAGEKTCPIGYVVSGMCYAPWSHLLHLFAFAVGSGVAGALVVALPALVAPMRAFNIALTAFAIGVVAGTYMLVQTGAWLLYVSALVCGGISCWAFKNRRPNT
ncbi:hypothetical protein [uncultured Thiodictyon sp.]|uniref:hypothetical protein n=1 Tax=uncultured Thiodictyon sp. TaxID=1846217 RepID=UPI0025F406E2|nr:hypothetical protein [uncultured Thiodictyon sp.]